MTKSILPRAQLILGYKEFFNSNPPEDRLSIVGNICKRNLIAELAGLNYRLKPKNVKQQDTTLNTQSTELQYFCGGNDVLFKQYARIASSYTPDKDNYPLIFTRQTCLFGLEEILQSNLPVIDGFYMSNVEIWNSLFKYILAINTELTKIDGEDKDEPINFESLNPKMLPLNELSLNSDPFHIPFRGFKLLEYLEKHQEIGIYLLDYLKKNGLISCENFVFQMMGAYFANSQNQTIFDFHYNVDGKSKALFENLSKTFEASDISKLLSIRKFPFYKSGENSYMLTDNILLLEKLYNQFINDFWFDYVKELNDDNGNRIFSIKAYKSIIGFFFEDYIRETTRFMFSKAKYYSVLQFDELKTTYKGNQIEIADLYIRYNSKVIIGQVKSTTLYDSEKYAGNLDVFYKGNRDGFFESFGVNQLVKSIKRLREAMPLVDNKFPTNKNIRVFPVIIFNEKALQTPLMGKIFNDRFLEMISDFSDSKMHIYPLTLVHVSDFETIQDFLFEKYGEVWDLLMYHCRSSKFMPPFYYSINKKGIRPNYKRTIRLYEELIPKFST